MRLHELIAGLAPARLAEIASKSVPGASEVDPHMLGYSLENVLCTTGQVEHVIIARRPPVLALLSTLLEASGLRAGRDELRVVALKKTAAWCSDVTRGELLGRDEQCRIYRRLLRAAWANDLQLDPSETALLGLLRKELVMSQAEHFLMCHHSDIQPYWNTDDAFEIVERALLDHGIIYAVDADLVLPEDLERHVRRALGIFMAEAPARRLFAELGNETLREALVSLNLKSSGSKPERTERLIQSLAPTPTVLDAAGIHELRDIARKVGCAISGSKDELAGRLMDYFSRGQDLIAPVDVEEPPQQEERVLDRAGFGRLFSMLKGHQLRTLLDKEGLRVSGSKDDRIETLWTSHLSEASLLRSLKNDELAALLQAVSLDVYGPKDVRIQRLIEFSREPPEAKDLDADSGAS